MSDSEGLPLSSRTARRALAAASAVLMMAVAPAHAGIGSEDCISAATPEAAVVSSTDSGDVDAGAPVLSGPAVDASTPLVTDGEGPAGSYTQASGYGPTNG